MSSRRKPFRLTPRPHLAESELHAMLLAKQAEANAASDDFLFIELTITYDGLFQIRLSNFEDDHGTGDGFDLDEAFQTALDMLVGMREARLIYASEAGGDTDNTEAWVIRRFTIDP